MECLLRGIFGLRLLLVRPGFFLKMISADAVAGDRIERVFAGRAQISGKSMTEVRADAMAEQSIKAMIDPKDIAALAVFLASDAGKSISGQVLPIDNDRQRA
jgi:NAD(P)-dependent dehydrogenase (short-subunit alcohol dehydrogenase family)